MKEAYCNELHFTCCGMDCCHGRGERPMDVLYRGKVYHCCCKSGEALTEHIQKEVEVKRAMKRKRLFELMTGD